MVSAYAGFLLATEAAELVDRPSSLAAARLLAVVHGASVALRRVSPRLALLLLLLTAAAFTWTLGLPVWMLGPAVLFLAYSSAVRLGPRRASLDPGTLLAGAVVLLRTGPHFVGWASVILHVTLITAAGEQPRPAACCASR